MFQKFKILSIFTKKTKNQTIISKISEVGEQRKRFIYFFKTHSKIKPKYQTKTNMYN